MRNKSIMKISEMGDETSVKKSEVDESKIRIIHTMADGSVRDSVDGYIIPYNEKTSIVYELLANWISEKQTYLTLNK